MYVLVNQSHQKVGKKKEHWTVFTNITKYINTYINISIDSVNIVQYPSASQKQLYITSWVSKSGK